MSEAGRNHWRSSGPTFLLEQSPVEHIIQHCVQRAFGYLQGRRLHNLSGQPLPEPSPCVLSTFLPCHCLGFNNDQGSPPGARLQRDLSKIFISFLHTVKEVTAEPDFLLQEVRKQLWQTPRSEFISMRSREVSLEEERKKSTGRCERGAASIAG